MISKDFTLDSVSFDKLYCKQCNSTMHRILEKSYISPHWKTKDTYDNNWSNYNSKFIRLIFHGSSEDMSTQHYGSHLG